MNQAWRDNPNLVECYQNTVATLRSWAARERAEADFKSALSDPYGQRDTKVSMEINEKRQ